MTSSFARGLVYIMGVTQTLVVALCVFMYPAVKVQLFVYTPVVENGTLSHEQGHLHALHFGLDFPCIVSSILIASFVTTTFSLIDSGTFQENNTYSPESLQFSGVWDPLFWAIVALIHVAGVVAACSPMDLFALFFSAFLLTQFLRSLCAPIDPERGPMLVNFSLVGYISGFAIAIACVPAGCSARYAILFSMATLDYFLGVGHTWDRSPTIETIANCRLFWACAAALCVATLYATWRDDLLMPLARDGDDA